jgi:hypothetical protein
MSQISNTIQVDTIVLATQNTGAIPIVNIDKYSHIQINQTTGTLTVPILLTVGNPSDTSVSCKTTFSNTGTGYFAINGSLIKPNGALEFLFIKNIGWLTLGTQETTGGVGNVRSGITSPTVLATDKENDTYIRTDASGTTQTVYVLDNAVWKLISVFTDPIVDVTNYSPDPLILPVSSFGINAILTPNIPLDKDTLYRLVGGTEDGKLISSNGTQYLGNTTFGASQVMTLGASGKVNISDFNAPTLLSSYNVASVTGVAINTSPATYKVNFLSPLPASNYHVELEAESNVGEPGNGNASFHISSKNETTTGFEFSVRETFAVLQNVSIDFRILLNKTISSTAIIANALTPLPLHSAKLRRVASQVIANGNENVNVLFDTQDDNPYSIGKLLNANSVVITQNGSYNLVFRGGFEGSQNLPSGTNVQWKILKNGIIVGLTQDNEATVVGKNCVSNVVVNNLNLVVGDTISCQLFQNSGLDKNSGIVLQAQPTLEITQNATHTTALIQPLRVFAGVGLPSLFPPTGSPADGDTYRQTSDGLADGILQSSWVYSSSANKWLLISSVPTALATTSNVRTYYPSTTLNTDRWSNSQVTPAFISGLGFTAVGGATITPYSSGTLFFGYSMMQVNIAKPIQANTFTAPTNFVRHEVAITSNSANSYFIQTLGESAIRGVGIEVWICNPVTGIPLPNGRLYGQCTDTYDLGTNSQTYFRSPKNTQSFIDHYRQWYNWEIPQAIIDANKTITNTIKLAIRPAVQNGEGNLFYITGVAMAKSDYNYIYTPYLQMNWFLNETVVTTQNNPSYWGIQGGMGTGFVLNGQNKTLRIPITDITKDVYLTIMGLYRPTDNSDGMMYSAHINDYKIISASGDINLGQPRLDVVAPSSTIVEQGYRPCGYIIPASTLASKVIKPAGSAINYLQINVEANPINGLNNHFAGFITESVN